MSYLTTLSSEQVKFVIKKIKYNDDHTAFEEIMLYNLLYELEKISDSYPKYMWTKSAEYEFNDEEYKELINSIFGLNSLTFIDK